MSVIIDTPSGVTELIKPNTTGNTKKYAKAMPTINSSTLETINGTISRFSWAYSPGATNAQIWYSVLGKASTKATIMVTVIGTKNGGETSVAIMCAPAGSTCISGLASKW